MIKKFFAVATVFLILGQVAFALPTTEPSLKEYQELRQQSELLNTCIEQFQSELRSVAKEFGEWMFDVFGRIRRIQEIRQTCDRLQSELPDNPRPWQIAQLQACEISFQTIIAAETARLAIELTIVIINGPVAMRDTVERFLVCAANANPDADPINPLNRMETSYYENLLVKS